jgi:hypothetical protein
MSMSSSGFGAGSSFGSGVGGGTVIEFNYYQNLI